MAKIFLHIILIAGSFLLQTDLFGQYKIKGTVYDSSRRYYMPFVTVQSTGGKIAVSDANGNYEISAGEKDSIWFSYLNKPTKKYALIDIKTPLQFDIALHVPQTELKEVKVRTSDYKQDSIQNRKDYANVFNWQKAKLKAVTPSMPGATAGFDLNEIIRMFQFRKNRSMASFKERLLEQEREKFIDHRFNKGLVLRLTGLNGEARDSFMLRCRPIYEFCLAATDYEFQSFIKDCFEDYKKEKAGDLFLPDRKTFRP